MRVLGIDPGSESLGWGILDGGSLKYRGIAYGVIRPGRGLTFSKRLSKIHNDLTEVIGKYDPEVLAIEEAFFAKNAKVAIKLGQVRGVVLLIGETNGLEIAEYSPRLIKQTVVGYGNAEKSQVQEMVRILLKLDKIPESHDAADALATGICHFHHCGK
ncbi:MAG TPA: crossover junction endodeoxyribonuclease RuvC [Aridibacter sp.]|nr:crossover junction endodeoxyribonuclease RuvC [Aridibacter sp.]